MKSLTIRQASEVIGRAPATIRRYIRSGRLPAEKEQGKFGVEYKIRGEDLQALGVVRGDLPAVRETGGELLPVRALMDEIGQRYVPRELYSELAMKHERLLVQYGMIRAGGQKVMETRAELEMKESLVAEREREILEIRERSEKEIGFLQTHLRHAEIEIEDRNIEVSLLRERIRQLEMGAAGAPAVRSFDEQVRSVREKGTDAAGLEPDAHAGTDAKKIDVLQEWLKACGTEREKGDS